MTPQDSDLFAAAVANQWPEMQAAIQAGADVKARNHDQKTPLHFAATYGCVEAARFLIEHGADVNARCSLQKTPLHFAVRGDYPKTARLLVENGADIHAGDRCQRTPLDYAVIANNPAMLAILGGDSKQPGQHTGRIRRTDDDQGPSR